MFSGKLSVTAAFLMTLFFCYSPPEDLVLPRNFPRVPFPALAALLAPLAWSVGAPDLFDSYSAGVILIQLAGEDTE